jgi:antitoxin component YwqK of YwqJK toxin-antitoxin module
MKNLVLLFCVSLSQLIFSQNKIDEKGKKQGQWVKTYPNSKAIEFKGQFKDDKPYGEFVYFFQSGKIKARTNFIENSSSSYSVLFHENEVILAEGKFIGKEKDSTWNFYGNHGHLGLIENYKKGVLHGKRTVFYVPENLKDTTKRISQVCNYNNGAREGEFIEYFDNGVLKNTSKYEKGKCVGVALSYHPNGKLMLKDTYLNGAKEGWCYAYNEEGTETGKSYFHLGQRLSEEELQKFLKKNTQKK